MFIDTTRIQLKAGDGGNGCNSFLRTSPSTRGKPNGGPGGGGGDIIVIADRNIQTLLDFRYQQHFTADRGLHGSSNTKKGRSGAERIIRVPPGTVIIDSKTRKVLRDLSENNQRVVVARGGDGGKGNSRFRPSTKGEPGEELEVILELKLIAEVGIVGYPNAGKSTLISSISKTRPKVASYPFTTKAPMLGVVRTDKKDFIIADIPGLIKGAHAGKGLGHTFLKHVERTKILLHLVDLAGVDGRDPVQDYKSLSEELGLYSKKLLKKKQIIALNKIDLPEAAGNLERFKSNVSDKVYLVSALEKRGLADLLEALGDAL